jgi:hypothetical protein
MMEELRYSETSVITIATRRNFPEDDFLHLCQYCCVKYIVYQNYTNDLDGSNIPFDMN